MSPGISSCTAPALRLTRRKKRIGTLDWDDYLVPLQHRWASHLELLSASDPARLTLCRSFFFGAEGGGAGGRGGGGGGGGLLGRLL
eukprot:86434-Pyramimonas_sp.AAC.1